ncbi:aldo/keto reductase [Agromyces archimandritae]|uniref:Aldo/keto reductase n=1 Tax=Agromyces archimandritae TaxID=2781962 RepID=A0A975FNM6_9MICO|nr:aldo/keto reductase [Agromyces archimandritae]
MAEQELDKLHVSLDRSLGRLGLDYVDIFYSHRPDPETPLEETMGALAEAVRQGKALYVGISSYSAADSSRAAEILADLGVPLTIHQPSYSILNRWIETDGLLDAAGDAGFGIIGFAALDGPAFTESDLARIDELGGDAGVDLWAGAREGGGLPRLRA